MKWDYATIADIYEVALEMRKRDLEELLAVTNCDNREELATHLAIMWGSNINNTYVFCDGDEKICCLTYTPLRDGVWSFGLFATNSFNKIYISLTKFILRVIIPHFNAINAHRVECQSIANYEYVHKWLEFIGLKRESTLKGYGKNGEDFYNFAYVRNKGEANLKWIKNGVIEQCV
tara:strand:+ start:5609 stop:6136 length:528 start_codon:yes stop_codon:yes gene_type:complete